MNKTSKPGNNLHQRLKQLGLGSLPPIPPIPDIASFKKDLYDNSILLHHKPSRRVQRQISSRARINVKSAPDNFDPLKKANAHKISLDFKAGDTGNNGTLYNRSKQDQLPPLSESWILRILQKVPAHYDVNNKEIKDLLIEVHEIYKDSLTNLTVRQMLTISTNKAIDEQVSSLSRDARISELRAKYFIKCQKEIRKRLFLLDPSLRCLLTLCKDVLGNMIILDIKSYRSLGEQDCGTLLEMIKKDCSKAEDKVLHSWFPKVVDIVSKPRQKKCQSKYSLAYYKCVTSILSAQFKELVHRSLQSIVNVYTSDSNTFAFPILKITLKLQNATIVPYPTIQDFEILVSEIITQVIKTLSEVPTVDSWLSDGAVTMMETSLPETVIQNAIEEIGGSIKRHFDGPQSLIDSLIKKYNNLINGEAKKEITTFLSIRHEFEEYCEIIDYYNGLTFSIANISNIEYFPMFAVFCSKIKEILIQAANSNRNYVLDFVVKQNKEENMKVCKFLARMKGRMKKIPSNVKEMVQLKSYVQKVETEDVLVLEKEVQASYNRLSYLLQLYEFNEDDIILNGYTLTIPGQIGPLIKTCKETLEDCKHRFDEELQNRIEKLGLDIEKLQVRVKDLEECGSFDLVSEFMQDVRSVERRVKELQETIKQINEDETLFGFPLSTYADLEDVVTNMNLFKTLFGMVTKWQKTEKQWMDGNFLELDAEVIELNINNLNRDFHKLQKVFRARQKQQEGDGKRSVRWGEDKMEGEAVSPPVKLCLTTLDKIREFKMHLPIVNTLCRPGIRPRHWHKMHKLIGYQLMPESGGTLRMVLQYDLYPHLEKLETVTISAAKEYAMEKAIQKLLHEWDHVTFTTVSYRDTGATILTALDEVQFALDDHVVKIQTMRASPFIQPFEEDVQKWEAKLLRTQETIDEWLKVQSQWMYLEPIFSSKDIVQQMPEEGKLFFTVDQNWRSIMKIVIRDPKVMSTAGDEDMLESLKKNTMLLDQINQGLNDYLEQKRLYFPRFFFLSNDEILEILSETRDPLRVQPHLKKCFEGVAKLEFDEATMNICAMFSSEGERVELTEEISTVDTKGQVEKWLLRVQEIMHDSVKDCIRKARLVYPTVQLKEWVVQWPGQAVLCVSQLFWTSHVHDALCSGNAENALKNYLAVIDNHIANVVNLIRGQLEMQARITLNSFVVIEVHARDVVTSLLKKGTSSSNDFEWLSQLRYYWENDDCQVRITNATIQYSYEYLGNAPRLVITPLTDRCYRTLIGAFHLNLNGAPEGPAGTGKTETVKDLAKALAIHCVVFNCSEGLNYLAMGKFFKGLASSGAWACFDEFNRIDLEVLSVVAQQILTIMQAVRAKLTKFVFEGTEIQLNHNCFTCITQNPGYAGRTELPDNLKALFRTVAMMIPDYVMISEIILYSYGFIDARNQATKIVTTYRLCSEQLSSQSHYDYGMRAVKTVLSTAGLLKLRHPGEKEEILVLRSIVDVNLPKFLPHDIPLFEGIVSDLFPGVRLPSLDYHTFLEIATEVCQLLYLVPSEIFMQKLIQVYETMIVRHGFMLVGETMGGKTKLLEVLAETLTLMHKRNLGNIPGQVIRHVVNPMSITMGQLYGQFDPASREWTDGVVAKLFREVTSSTNMDYKWIIFDGPVDTLWVENMNAVLDDNKKLCLMSGEIISMSPTMSIIFEVMDLQNASPATVSRCGMVYIEPKALGWEPIVESWITRVSASEDSPWVEGHDKLIRCLCYWIITPSLTFVRKHCKEVIPTTDSHLVLSFLGMVEGLLNDACENRRDIEVKYNRFWILGAFAFSLVWSIGALCDVASRPKFSAFMRQHLSGKSSQHPVPVEIGKFDVTFPNDGLVYDYVYEFQQKGQWKHWNDFLWSLESEMDNITNVWQLIVPTVETIRCNYLIDISVKQSRPLLFLGPTGTGKSVHVKNKLLKNLSKDKYISVFVLFSAQTSASQVQDIILSNLDKRRKGVYGPPVGKKKCVVFLDDIHLPSREAFGCQPPLELLRQYFDHHFWYDRKDQSKMHLVDLTFLATLGITGVADDNGISPRVLRHFNMVALNPFGNDTLRRIFTSTLNHHFRMGCFPVDTFAVIPNIVSATMLMYKAVTCHLLPTPQKFYYLFNLRDMARVVLGCCLIRKESVSNKRTFTRLWTHEVLRVFYDRLVDDDDQHWFYDQLRECIQTHFKDNFDLIFERLGAKNRKIAENDLKNLMFGDYMQSDLLPEDRLYEEVTAPDIYQQVVQSAVEEYNNTNKARVDLVIFPYVLEHLSRICRVLRIPGGHCLLIGANGCGRQTLTRLAASMSGFALFQPEVTKNYGRIEWKDDIKSMLRCIGIQGRPTVFLVTDSHIKQECFLEDIDSLLNSGEVPNLFQADEKQDILQAMRAATGTNAAHSGHSETNTTLAQYAAFVARCRENLHLVIAFNPHSNTFRHRLRQFPSLVHCCTIDWFQPWPTDALECVAQHYLRPLKLDKFGKGKEDVVVKVCQYFHETTRNLATRILEDRRCHVYVTPTTFLHLLDTLNFLLSNKENELKAARKRYVVGLEKLVFAASQVAEMQEELRLLQPQLIESASKAQRMMMIIENETKEVESKRHLLQNDEATANTQAAEAKSLRDECENDLAEAIPALEAAIASLDTLKPADITVLKSMKNPPPAVKLVMEAVCVMMDVKPTKVTDTSGSGVKVLDYWGPSKKMLGDLNFLSKLKEYDKDSITVAVITKISKDYLPNPEFKPNIVAKASSAAEGLCKWVCAMELYDRTAKIVAPKKVKLLEADEKLSQLMATLETKRKDLSVIEKHLFELKQQLNETMKEKSRLENQTELCALKLRRARDLIDGLGDEKDRWNNEAQLLNNALSHLLGDILLAAGELAYLGPFTSYYRTNCLQDWADYVNKQDVQTSENFTLSRTLGDPLKIQTWTIAGLPNDAFSIDNAVMIYHTRRWPIMIDPQGQACKWIKTMEQSNHLAVVKPSSSNYQRVIEACIQNGVPLLIENIGEDVDPALEPLLLKQTFFQGGVEMIRFGDKLLDYNSNFRLMMTTKLHNPHYPSEFSVKVCLVNFLITMEGLEDQLLGIIVTKERPELESEHHDFVIQSSKNKFELKEVEDKILETLSASEGNILEDETAIHILDSSKQLAVEIITKQKIAEETEKLITESRRSYQPVAKHSAVLFFCLTGLSNIDSMYHYSLAWFVRLFNTSLDNSEKSNELDKRLENLIKHFTYSIYVNVCRSLFEKHKLIFSFILCCNLLMTRGELNKTELMFFLTGGIGLEVESSNPALNWLPNQAWQEFCRLSQLPNFIGLQESFVKCMTEWCYYFKSDNHQVPLPEPWSHNLTDFQALCVVRCLRPDRVIPSLNEFIQKHLGKQFIQPPQFNLNESYVDSTASSPLLYLLSPGTDPLSSLQRFAAEKRIPQDRLHIISLGQGQGPVAEQAIEKAKVCGDWVLLQNCHLAISWLPTLEIICERLEIEETHPEFRLWLTSYPSDKFPVSLLQNSIKMTNEPPAGLKHCLLRVYQDEPIKNSDFFNSCPGKEETFRRLLFAISFFHALVSERRKYGSMGWNIAYGFNDSDLAISLQQLQMFVGEYVEIPFNALTYMIGECNYGGRVTDDWDRRLLITILKDICNENVLNDEKFKITSNGTYFIPTKSSYEEYLQHIEELPSKQDSEVFGLHQNVDISRNLQESRFLWDAMLLTEGNGFRGQGTEITDKALYDITTDILRKLPENFDLHTAAQRFPLNYGDSMNTVLVQEMKKYNRLLLVIRNSLKALVKALEGLVMMTEELEMVAGSLIIGKIPPSWAAVSYPSLRPLGSYINDLLTRIQFLDGWFHNGQPAYFWLPGFFFTQAFLTAVLQNHARKYSIPIDELEFDFKVMQLHEAKIPPSDGAYISGLYLEGAQWDHDRRCLTEQTTGVLWDPMPIIWLLPSMKESVPEEGRYPCPLYKTRERKGSLSTTGHSTNYVLTVLLPSDKPVKHWVKRGTALICQLDT